MGNAGSSKAPSKPQRYKAKDSGDTKKPKEPVTVIARAAGKLWSRMSPEQKKRYIDLANAEKKRREGRRRKRKHNPYSRRH